MDERKRGHRPIARDGVQHAHGTDPGWQRWDKKVPVIPAQTAASASGAMRGVFLLAITVALFDVALAFFSTDFTQWLDKHHGVGARQWIERADLKSTGSFGGRKDANQTLAHNPVVFVHGVSHTVGTMMKEAAMHYWWKGYTEAETYGITYDNPKGDKMRWMKYTMECDHVKRIRFLIEAVHAYTGRPVDVVAFSMGVPISRKAILGGHCVENNHYIGAPITDKMGTYVGVAGPNKGVAPVLMGIPYALCAMSPFLPVCNPVDGLFSGFCPFKSRFIDDINRSSRYEGQRIYTIGSTMDEVVGYYVCMEVTTRIKGQNGEKIFKDKKHDPTFKSSFDTQLAMLNGWPF
ncbi:hypothetical protein PRIPAC_96892 [Pristionchus pacificus]|uniref:Lipase n=1 Tax=Pristionchus pacificus TaxID=54126 RepID=A0A2A6B2Q0_PRIPA|nr:hypothetical protein PRIPAC_96892 [Pristionchus pacificus]|eukprot:PDM60157.1 lipase [Pristionchus pacificus]